MSLNHAHNTIILRGLYLHTFQIINNTLSNRHRVLIRILKLKKSFTILLFGFKLYILQIETKKIGINL